MNVSDLLKKDGIAEIACGGCKNSDLIDIASSLGRVVPGARNEQVQYLPARGKGSGPAGSFFK